MSAGLEQHKLPGLWRLRAARRLARRAAASTERSCALGPLLLARAALANADSAGANGFEFTAAQKLVDQAVRTYQARCALRTPRPT